MFKTNWNKKLLKAAEDGDLAAFDRALEKGADINHQNLYVETALHLAAYAGENLIVERAIKAGAAINARNYLVFETPLHKASQQGHLQTVRALINAGADLESADRYCGTPLMQALTNQHMQVAQALITAGADVFAKSVFYINAWDMIANFPPEDAKNLERLVGESLPKKFLLEKYKKLSDVELSYSVTNLKTQVETISLYDFELKDLTRGTHAPDKKPVRERIRFHEMEDQSILRQMFNKLVELDGHPPKDSLQALPVIKKKPHAVKTSF